MKNPGKFFKLTLLALVTLFLIGLLFKIEHWPFANLIIISSFCGLILFYPLRFAAKSQKKFIDYVKLVFILFWSVSGIFTILHLPYAIIFHSISSASFIIWFFMEGFSYFTGDENSKNSSAVILQIAFVTVVIGVIFKIQHWPYDTILLCIGLGLLIIGGFKDFITDQK